MVCIPGTYINGWLEIIRKTNSKVALIKACIIDALSALIFLTHSVIFAINVQFIQHNFYVET